jgi:hypothetical protein
MQKMSWPLLVGKTTTHQLLTLINYDPLAHKWCCIPKPNMVLHTMHHAQHTGLKMLQMLSLGRRIGCLAQHYELQSALL